MISGWSRLNVVPAHSFGVAALAVTLASALTAGCRSGESRFEVVDYRSDGEPCRYHESFEEAYYTTELDGNMTIVLRRQEPTVDDSRESISQIVRIATFWRSQPGRTIADSTQINGTVSYAIIGPGGGTAYEGTGSVFFEENRDRNELEGSLDQALLSPVRTIKEGQPIFEKAQLKGKFQAVRDRRQVVRIMNETNRLFGPAEDNGRP